MPNSILAFIDRANQIVCQSAQDCRNGKRTVDPKQTDRLPLPCPARPNLPQPTAPPESPAKSPASDRGTVIDRILAELDELARPAISCGVSVLPALEVEQRVNAVKQACRQLLAWVPLLQRWPHRELLPDGGLEVQARDEASLAGLEHAAHDAIGRLLDVADMVSPAGISLDSKSTDRQSSDAPAGHDGDSGAAPVGQKQQERLSVQVANELAVALAKADKRFVFLGMREWAERIGCSTGLVAKLPFWNQTMEASRRGRKDHKRPPKAVSLTGDLEAAIGDDDAELQRLMGEQKADFEPSPLEKDQPAARPRKIRTRKRL